VQRWLVRLSLPSSCVCLSPTQIVTLESELAYLRPALNIESSPPVLEVSVLADGAVSAATYACGRIHTALRRYLGSEAWCDPISMYIDVRWE
jgi:hypothetical protein